MSKRIAVIGVGLMGSSLAKHLVTAGFPVTVHDTDAENHLILIKGAVPGPKNGIVEIREESR